MVQAQPTHSVEAIPLHKTFAAEVRGVDFSRPILPEVFAEIKRAITKYGVVVFRNTGLDDAGHVEFSRLFGELDDYTPYCPPGTKSRLAFKELFDVSNLDIDGNIAQLDSDRVNVAKGNFVFHIDSSFNPRRASYSLLKAHELPGPQFKGGETEYADTRTAYNDLPQDIKDKIANAVVAHSSFHSRKKASPEFFKDLDPAKYPMSRHRLVQLHEPSGRMNLYIAAHAHHIEGMKEQESTELLKYLFGHASQAQYVCTIKWENAGDLILWDNTCVMHRATHGDFEGRAKRDMRRTTVHDSSSTAWGLNEVGSAYRAGFP